METPRGIEAEVFLAEETVQVSVRKQKVFIPAHMLTTLLLDELIKINPRFRTGEVKMEPEIEGYDCYSFEGLTFTVTLQIVGDPK